MSYLNAVLRPLFDLLLFPFRGLPAIVGVAVVSLVFGIGMLLIFKYTSNQEALEAAKRRIHAGLFEIRLFNDDLRAIFRAQWDILRHNLTYLRYAAVPLIWMLPPFVLIVAQLQFHYGYHAFQPGDTTLLEVTLDESWGAGAGSADSAESEARSPRPPLSLELPEGIEATAPPVWAAAERQMVWRLRAAAPGDYEIGVRMGDAVHSKALSVTERIRRLSPERLAPRFLDQLLYPAEPSLPKGSGIASIGFEYPVRDVWLLGWRTHWLVVFFILSIVFAFALRNRFGVTI